jgi:diaminopimelate decarboxylase
MSASGRAHLGSHDFKYHDGVLHIESTNLELLAQRFGTPLYVYSRAAITAAWQRFSQAFDGDMQRVHYAVKANSNLTILRLLANLGAGFDIVSAGELERVLRAGGNPAGVVFSGVGKRADEMQRALEVGIQCFNVESETELLRLSEIADSHGKTSAVALRINPQVETATHPHIATGHREAKFGIDSERAEALYRQAARLPGVRIVGIACHIGSQITQPAPFLDAARHVMRLVDRLLESGIALQHVDLGGGFGVRYRDEPQMDVTAVIRQLRQRVEQRGLKLILEPGRALVAEAGVLLTRVEYLKTTNQGQFAIVDAGMSELIRPPLYDAWHEIREVTQRPGIRSETYDVVGPVCESADTLGRDRQLAVQAGDLLAILNAGAYGFSMSSNYNTRPRAAEILVDGAIAIVIRRRETLDELMRPEDLPVSGTNS